MTEFSKPLGEVSEITPAKNDNASKLDLSKPLDFSEQKSGEAESGSKWSAPMDFSEKKEDMAQTDITEISDKQGGRYKDLHDAGHGWNHEPPEEVHHMPSNDASDLPRDDGPAIVMDRDDHRETASCGNSKDAQEYRAKQKELINQGKFREALQMDIDDIHEKFADKYDDAIKDMLDYVDKLEEEGRV